MKKGLKIFLIAVNISILVLLILRYIGYDEEPKIIVEPELIIEMITPYLNDKLDYKRFNEDKKNFQKILPINMSSDSLEFFIFEDNLLYYFNKGDEYYYSRFE